MAQSGMSAEAEAVMGFGIQDFFAKMWEEVEFNMGRNIAPYYKSDCVLTVGKNLDCRGRKEVEKFYAHRRDMGGRVSRHILGNYRFDFSSFQRDARVTMRLIMTHFGNAGEKPFPSALPLGIYDIEVVVERQADSSWQIVSLVGDPYHLSAENPYWTLPKELGPAALR